MSLVLVLSCLWILAATCVALLPMRHQYAPGIALLIAAPVLIILIGWQYGLWLALAALLGFVSMFRNPLRYLWKRARGIPVELPPEMRKGKR